MQRLSMLIITESSLIIFLNISSPDWVTNARGEVFEIQVGNTDNDACECKVLAVNWPGVFLLLCTFHVWQAW